MGATFSRVKNWIAEVLTYADLNAEIDNILTYFTPSGMDDYSATATQMRTDTDPGESGTESLATSLAGELERLRFAIREIKGSGVTYWYQSGSTSLTEIASALGTSILANRISSGRVRTGSSQPLFLVPNGAARTVTLQGASTNFVFFYESTQVTISSNVTATGLTAAPSSNNTCLVNMPGVAGQSWSKMLGEYGTTITVDAMGSEISNLSGKLVGLKIAGAATEYAIGRVDSATQLSNINRGYFFDSADAPIPRTTISDNDTITLMKLTWIYAKSDGTIQPGYTNPSVSADEPTSPSIGDYWHDLSANKWKYYSGSWADLDGILVGVCLQDTTNTVAARGFDFFKNFEELNTLNLARSSATLATVSSTGSRLSVYGTMLNFGADRPQWSTATDFDSGVSEAASTIYFMYVKESGDRILSDLAPVDRTADLLGLYHPFHTWRCVGQIYNNASQDFVACISYHDTDWKNYKITTQVAASALTTIIHANPLSKFPFSTFNATDIALTGQIPTHMSLVLNSTSTLGHTSAVAEPLYCHLMLNAGTPWLGIASVGYSSEFARNATQETAGVTGRSTIYAEIALTSVGSLLVGQMTSTQSTAGTWATAPENLLQYPVPYSKIIARYQSTSGSNITNSTSLFEYGSKLEDSHNCVTTSPWKFTSQKSTWYRVSASLFSSTSNAPDDTASRGALIDVYKAGTYHSRITSQTFYGSTVATSIALPKGSGLVFIEKGNYIDFRVSHNVFAGNYAANTTAGLNIVEIEEI